MGQATKVKAGDDVTALMGAAPPVVKSGDDVTALMGPSVSRTPSTNTGLAAVTASKAVPVAAQLAEEFVTNPNVPKAAAAVGRVVGGVAPIAGHLAKGDPFSALVRGFPDAALGSWTGGKTGWFTGKLAQRVTAPVASVLTKVAPYMQAVTTLGAVQSALDLHQMLDPKRKDIGTLGIGKTEHVAGEHPALLNLAVSKLREAFDSLMEHGFTKDEAADLLVQSQKAGR